MFQGRFKFIMLFALILPLLVSFAGYLLYAPNSDQAENVAVTNPGNQQSTGEEIQIAGPEKDLPQETDSLGFKELIIYLALLAGISALFGYYLKKATLTWIFVVILPMIFCLFFVNETGLSLIYFYIPTLVMTALMMLLIRHLFYYAKFVRIRMLLCSLSGAALLTLYLRSLYLLTSTPFLKEQWASLYVSSLIMLVFVTFGLSLADMVILRALAKNEPAVKDDEDEDVSAND